MPRERPHPDDLQLGRPVSAQRTAPDPLHELWFTVIIHGPSGVVPRLRADQRDVPEAPEPRHSAAFRPTPGNTSVPPVRCP